MSQCYLVNVDVNSEECFFETLAQHEKMAIAYDVVDGGFLDIQFRLLGPNQSTIHDDQLTHKRVSTTGRYTFSAYSAGVYQFCFTNAQASFTVKDVKFLVELQSASRVDGVESGDDTLVGQYVKELISRLKFVKYEAEFAVFNLAIHHDISEKVNYFVTCWASFETLLAMVITLGQVLYLRKLLEKRSRV